MNLLQLASSLVAHLLWFLLNCNTLPLELQVYCSVVFSQKPYLKTKALNINIKQDFSIFKSLVSYNYFVEMFSWNIFQRANRYLENSAIKIFLGYHITTNNDPYSAIIVLIIRYLIILHKYNNIKYLSLL